MPTALLIDPTIKFTALRVYGLLASHKDEKGYSWVSSYTMGTILGVARPNVARALKQLSDGGYIRKLNRGGGPKNSAVYAVIDPAKCISRDTIDDAPEAPETGQTEQKFFAVKGISRDTPRVSHGILKYNPKGLTLPLPLPAGGDAAGADAPTLGPAPGVACGDGQAVNAAPDGATLDEGAACGRVQSGGKKEGENSSFPSENKSAAYAREKIAEAIGYRNGAAMILMAADDPNDENHERASNLVQMTANRLGLRWAGPRHA